MNELLITPAPEGSRWPSGNYIDLATLPITEDELALRLGLPLLHGNEAGLGPWAAIGGKLPSGTSVEFIRYEFAPDSKVVLRVDKGSSYTAALNETLQIVGLSHNELPWITPLLNVA